jgi:tRNA A-37 threonylcarbamoyl transferase component Bud32
MKDLPDFGQAYRVLDRLGSGGFATVFRAEDTRLGRQVAIKVLRPENAENREHRRRFLREATALARLNHPNVLQVFSCSGPEEPSPYLVTELVHGPSLSDWITRSGDLPWEIALAVIEQALRGLACIHKANIVHRDIKPSNILLTEEGIPKIADLGIARLVDATSITQENASPGTLLYMPPEAFSGVLLDVAADLYGLACTLYEMISRRAPYDGQSVPALIHQIVGGRYRPLADVCPGLWPGLSDIVDRGMALAPSDRHPGAEEMRADCLALLVAAGTGDSAELLRGYAVADDGARWLGSLRRGEAEHLVGRAWTARRAGRLHEVPPLIDLVMRLAPDHPDVEPLLAGPVPGSESVLPAAPLPVTSAGAGAGAGARAGAIVATERHPSCARESISPAPPARDRILWGLGAVHAACGLLFAAILGIDPFRAGAWALAPVLLAVALRVLSAAGTRGQQASVVGAVLGGLGSAALFRDRFEGSVAILGLAGLGLPLLFALAAWLASGLALVLVHVRSLRETPRWWLRPALWGWSVGAITTSLLSSSLAAHRQTLIHRQQASLLLVATPPPPLDLILNTGYVLSAAQVIDPARLPLRPEEVLPEWASDGGGIAVHAGSVEVIHELERTSSPPSSRGASSRGASSGLAPAVSSLCEKIRRGRGPLVILAGDELQDGSILVSMDQFAAASARVLESWIGALGADGAELPYDDTGWQSVVKIDLKSSGDRMRWESLIAREAARLKARFPGLKVGICQSLDVQYFREDARLRRESLTRIAALPEFDWVGVRIRFPPLPAEEIDGVVSSLSAVGCRQKLWLLTGIAVVESRRWEWQAEMDAAFIELAARFARSRSIRTWVHGPALCLLTYKPDPPPRDVRDAMTRSVPWRSIEAIRGGSSEVAGPAPAGGALR